MRSADATDVRTLVEHELFGFLRARAGSLPDATAVLIGEIERVATAGGKRVRPAFCFWGYRAGGGMDDAAIARTAAALELVHTFAIVHDDVMDRSPVRRGLPSTHRHMAAAGARDPERLGASAAILVGDLAMTLADELWWSARFTGPLLSEAAGIYHQMRAEVIGGQYLDLLAAERGSATPEETKRISVLKSGRYTVDRPLQIGCALAGAPEPVREALAAYGAPLGEAFQHRDDVLGAFGDPAATGKDADGDLREGKQTLLVALAREHGSDEDRRRLDEALGRPALDPAAAEGARAALRDSGALGMVLAEIDRLVAEARAALRRVVLPAEALDALDGLASDVASTGIAR